MNSADSFGDTSATAIVIAIQSIRWFLQYIAILGSRKDHTKRHVGHFMTKIGMLGHSWGLCSCHLCTKQNIFTSKSFPSKQIQECISIWDTVIQINHCASITLTLIVLLNIPCFQTLSIRSEYPPVVPNVWGTYGTERAGLWFCLELSLGGVLLSFMSRGALLFYLLDRGLRLRA